LKSFNSKKATSLKIVAAGEIEPSGAISTGFNIDSVYWENTSKEYHIYIKSVNYDFHNYITVATSTGGPRIAWTNSAGGMLIVQLVENGVPVKDAFSFVTYRVN
jgi:hypothetical protein